MTLQKENNSNRSWNLKTYVKMFIALTENRHLLAVCMSFIKMYFTKKVLFVIPHIIFVTCFDPQFIIPGANMGSNWFEYISVLVDIIKVASFAIGRVYMIRVARYHGSCKHNQEIN